MLHAAAQLDQVEQDVLGGRLLRLDVDTGDGDQQVQTRNDVAGVLNILVQLDDRTTACDNKSRTNMASTVGRR